MKRTVALLISLVFALVLTGCSPTTITDNPVNYVYGAKEAIHIYDNMDTRKLIGEMKIISVYILNTKPIVLKEEAGTDSSSNPIYENVTYEMLAQVNYQYTNKNGNGKTISNLNFTVSDSGGNSGEENPDTAYKRVPVSGADSFIVALKKSSKQVDIDFSYDIFQSPPTAKIKVAPIKVASNEAVSSKLGTSSKSAISKPSISTVSSKRPGEVSRTESWGDSSESFNNSRLLLLVYVLTFVVIIFGAIIILLSVNLSRKNRRD